MRAIGLTAFSALVCSTGCLTVWQCQRYAWKKELIRDRLERLGNGEYRKVTSTKELVHPYEKVKLSGQYVNGSEFYLSPRSMPDSKRPEHGVVSGGYVYSLFHGPSGYAIVNRGWVDKNTVALKQKQNQTIGQPKVTICGITANGEQPNAFSVQHDLKHTKSMFWLDHDGLAKAMQADCDYRPPIVDVIEGDQQDEYVMKSISDYTQFSIMPWKHATYAATWFTLTIFGAIMTRKLFKLPKGKQI